MAAERVIFVGGGGSVRIPRLIGAARMTDMMLTGRVYNAEDGERIGLSQYVVPQGTALEKALATIGKNLDRQVQKGGVQAADRDAAGVDPQ